MRDLKKLRLLPAIFLLILLSIAACKPTRHIPSGRYLLVKNKTQVTHKYIESGDISSFIKQKPNHKQWGTYIRVRLYKLFNKGKDNKSKAWIRRTFGEEPVYLDSTLTDQSVKQIRLYLNSKGYFHSTVKRDITYNHKKNIARVTYNIDEAPAYHIRNITYSIGDATMDAYVASDRPRTLIKSGDRYDADKLSLERDRIAGDLSNYGYYYFSSDFIRFNIDTALKSHQLDVNIEIVDPVLNEPGSSDSLVTLAHRRYYVNNVYVHTDYDARTYDTLSLDTLRMEIPNRRKGRPNKVYYFIYHDKLTIKPKTLTQQIFVDSGDFYRYKDLDKSYKQLLDLKIYRYANIMMDDISDSSGRALLNVNMFLSKLPSQAIALETQVTNKGGNLGTALGVVYENRNLFHGAEIINFKVNGAVEIEKLNFKSNKNDGTTIKKLPFFNTVEAGTELSLKIPKFLMPIRQEKFSKNFRPKTNIGVGFNYQQRPNYTRYITKATFGYEWKESAAKTHLLTLLELNSVKIYPDSLFQELINNLPDKITQNTYRDHIITSIKYSYIYNTQAYGKNEDFMYFRGNMELAGFLFWIYNSVRGKHGSYLLFDVPYSQYARIDLDYRYYKYFSGETSLATRAYVGIGVPLTSNTALPYEKYFYLGGSNSMRGWRIRALGPGSYDEPDSLNNDNIGEIGLELNAELRFPMYKYLKGAFFIDAGNVWLRKKYDLYPNGEFKFNRFYSEIAIDAGLGLRIDFGYFLIRLDGAIPMKNPRLPQGDRWVFQNNNKLKILGNLGIGYPF